VLCDSPIVCAEDLILVLFTFVARALVDNIVSLVQESPNSFAHVHVLAQDRV